MKKFPGSLAFMLIFCVLLAVSVFAAPAEEIRVVFAAGIQSAPQTEDLFSIAIIILAIASGVFAVFFRKGKNA